MKTSQRKFTPSSKKNPCPICDRTKDGDCRIRDDGNLVICHTYSEAVDTAGWRFTGYSSGGSGGGIFVHNAGTTPRQARKRVKHPNERAGERVSRAIARSNPTYFVAKPDPESDRLVEKVKNDPTPEPEDKVETNSSPKETFVAKYDPEANRLLDEANNDPKPDPEDRVEANSPPEETIYQRVDAQLYSKDYWIAVGDLLYKWVGTHYEASSNEVESQRIREFAGTISETRRNKPSYVYATPDHVQKALKWVKFGRPVTAQQLNPPGINCTNGVLELHWEETKLTTKLVKHDPKKHFYLSAPVVTYDPHADPTEYERLMQCLDPASRNIWERTIAASLDLDTVRKCKGRAVRAALCKGDGANGKDTLRTVTQMVQGNGAMSSCSTSDFKAYDSGRKFPLYELKGKRVNWQSENADAGCIDQIRSLRAIITGDPIPFEQKGDVLEMLFLV